MNAKVVTPSRNGVEVEGGPRSRFDAVHGDSIPVVNSAARLVDHTDFARNASGEAARLHPFGILRELLPRQGGKQRLAAAKLCRTRKIHAFIPSRQVVWLPTPAAPIAMFLGGRHVPDAGSAVGVTGRTGQHQRPKLIALQVGGIFLHVQFVTGLAAHEWLQRLVFERSPRFAENIIHRRPRIVAGCVHVEIEHGRAFQRSAQV